MPSAAQVLNEFGGINPRVSLEYEKIPNGTVDGIGGYYGASSLSAGCTLPIGGDFSFSSKGFSGYRFLITAAASRTTSDLSALDRTIRFNGVRGGLTGILASEKKDFYRFSMMLGAVEDDATITTPRMRFTMAGTGTYHTSRDFTFLYGGTYTYLFGNGRLLPMGGFHWRFANQWNLSLILPLSVGLSYRANSDAAFRLAISPAGDRMRFENNGAFAGASDIITMRITQARIGAEAQIQIAQSVNLHVATGLLGARNVTFLSDNIVLQTGKVEGRGFVSARLVFRLDDTFFDQWFE